MGDEDFTKEELDTLGEETEEKGQETQDQETTGEEQESETEQSTETAETEEEQAEEEENLVPQSRVDQIVREREDLKRKNDLLKRDPDAYQKLYPDEFEEEETEQKVTPIKDFVIQDGPYEGKSLSELYGIDPIAANTIHFNLLEEQKAEKDQRANLEKQSQKELDEFSDTMAQEMFGKKVDELPEKDGKQIDDVINRVLDWMSETGRGGGNVADAYKLMNFDKILTNAAEKGVKSLIDKSSTGVKTVSTKKDTETKSGYDKFSDYTAEQLAAHLDNLTDAEADKFVKDAPQELKDKFPKAFAAWE